MKVLRKIVANHNGALVDSLEDRPTDPGPYALDTHDRNTAPDLSQWAEEASSRVRAITAPSWELGYARAQFSVWGAVRVWIAVRLARLAARIAP